MTLFSILIVVAICCALFGFFFRFWAHERSGLLGDPYLGWSPLGVALLLLLVLWLLGALRP